MADRWFTCKDLAQRWRVTPETVRRYIVEGVTEAGPKLPATKFGSYRIWPDDVEAFERELRMRDQSPEPAS